MNADEQFLIVIPCLNEQRFLPALLSQFSTECPGALIIVADGGSTDRSRSIVREWSLSSPQVVLLDNPKRRQAAGVNLAVAKYGARREWLLRVDAHCSYPPAYARKLLDAARLRKADSIVVPMVSCGKLCFQKAAAAAQNSIIGTGGSPHRHLGQGRFVDHGHHALMNMRAFADAGGYRDDMAANEDAELDMRLSLMGSRIYLETSAAVTYFPRSHALGLWRQYYRNGRGRMRTVRLHASRLKARQLLPLLVPSSLMLAAFSPWTIWLCLPAVAWACVVLMTGLVIGARLRDPCALFSGPVAMIMHLSWGLGAARELLVPPPTLADLSEPLLKSAHVDSICNSKVTSALSSTDSE